MSNPRISPEQRNNLIALLMQQGNDRPTACIILDAREAAAERNGRNRCLDHRNTIQARIAAQEEIADPLAPLRGRIDAARAYDEAHPDSPFEHLLDADTGQLVQVRRDGR